MGELDATRDGEMAYLKDSDGKRYIIRYDWKWTLEQRH